MSNSFSYPLSENESLVFKTERGITYLYSKHESARESQIAVYQGGKWVFEDHQQRKLFWFLFNIYKIEFGKAFKAYLRSLKEKPQMYEFTCVKRRFNIKITKLKRNWNNWFYWNFYGGLRN